MDTKKLKIGDGSTAWNSLKYVTFDGGDLDSGSPPPPPSPIPPSQPPQCPAPWMNILLSDGTKVPAGDIRKGMKVHTRREDNLEWGDYEVVAADTVMSERLKITVGDVEFTCSPSHKFWDGHGWVTADQLEVGKSLDGLRVASIENAEYGEVVRMTVDKAHTYICEGMLSHNKSTGTTMPPG